MSPREINLRRIVPIHLWRLSRIHHRPNVAHIDQYDGGAGKAIRILTLTLTSVSKVGAGPSWKPSLMLPSGKPEKGLLVHCKTYFKPTIAGSAGTRAARPSIPQASFKKLSEPETVMNAPRSVGPFEMVVENKGEDDDLNVVICPEAGIASELVLYTIPKVDPGNSARVVGTKEAANAMAPVAKKLRIVVVLEGCLKSCDFFFENGSSFEKPKAIYTHFLFIFKLPHIDWRR